MGDGFLLVARPHRRAFISIVVSFNEELPFHPTDLDGSMGRSDSCMLVVIVSGPKSRVSIPFVVRCISVLLLLLLDDKWPARASMCPLTTMMMIIMIMNELGPASMTMSDVWTVAPAQIGTLCLGKWSPTQLGRISREGIHRRME